MSKVRKNVSIDAELAELVDAKDEFNLSGFVNLCLEQHFAGTNASTPEKAVLQAQLEELEDDIAELSGNLDRKRDRRAQIEEQLEDVQDDEPELLGQAIEKLDGTPRNPDNAAVQKWAGKLGMPAEQLVKELPERETKL